MACRLGCSVSDLGATLVEEARRVSLFADIEFRTFGGERQVCLTGGLRLWKIIMIAQSYKMDVEKTAAHFALPVWRVQAAFDYFGAFPAQVDDAIAEARAQTFDTLKHRRSQLEAQEIVVHCRIGIVTPRRQN